MSDYENFDLVGAGQARWDAEPVNLSQYGPRLYFGDSREQVAQDIADIHSEYMDDYVDHSDPDAMPSADDIAEMLAWAGAL